MTKEPEEKRNWYVVTATLKLRGATTWANARDADEAKEIATRAPDFDTSGAELADFDITKVTYDSPA